MLKRLTLLVLLLAGMMISFTACSSDSTTEPTTPPGPTTGTLTNLSTEEQQTAATQTTSQVNSAIDMVNSNIDGLTGFGKYALKGKNPPTGWVAMGDGWYKETDISHGNTLFKVRFSPDIWMMTVPDPDLITKFELKYSYDSTMTSEQYSMQTGFLWDMLEEWQNTEKTFVKGHNNYNMIFKMTVPQAPSNNFDYSFNWNTEFDSVSTSSADKTAHFTFSSTWPFIANQQTNQVLWTSFSGEFRFAADGKGILDANDIYLAGKVSSNGNLFIKYYFDGTNGWYTIAADNFVTHIIWDPTKVKKTF